MAARAVRLGERFRPSLACRSYTLAFRLPRAKAANSRRAITVWDAERKRQETDHISLDTSGDRLRLTRPLSATPELRSLTQKVRELTRDRKYQEALRVFNTAAEPDMLLYNTALNACSKAIWKRQAEEIWVKMPREFKTVVGYNTMLDLCRRLKRPSDAEDFLKEMQEQGVPEDIITRNIMINVYSMAGEPRQAVELFKVLRASPLYAEASQGNQALSFLAAMSATARAGDYAGTRELFVWMIEAGIWPSIMHLNTLLSSCAAHGMADIAKEIFASLPAYRLSPRIEDYTTLMSCCRGSPAECRRIYGEATAAGLGPSPIMQEKMFMIFFDAGDKEAARQFLAETTLESTGSRRTQWMIEQLCYAGVTGPGRR